MGTFVGCDKASSAPGSPAASAADDHDDHDHAPAEPGVVSITSDVRENLGITFAQVEMRHVASTIRVPGRFEARPDAVREYRAPLAGRVELLVKQYDRVTTGTPLYRLDSAEWRRMQQEYVSAKAEVLVTSASLMAAQVASSGGGIAAQVTQNRVDAAEAHIDGLLASIKLAEEREKQVKRLHEIVGGRMSELVEARSQLASLRNSLNEAKEDRAELEQQRLQLSTDNSGGSFGTSETLEASAAARRAEYDATYARLYLLRANLESIQPDQGPLRDNLTHPSSWEIRPIITVRATAEGTISSVGVTSGAFLDISASVVTTVDEQRVRFRGVALQSDLHQLEGELPGSILMPGKSNAYSPEDSLPVTARLSLEADADKRTVDVVADVTTTATWARAGVSTDLELVLDKTSRPEMAIPVAAVVLDGVDKIYFRRDPNRPDIARRTKADMGLSDGRWVVLKSGVKAGDSVVVDGVYELKLATTASRNEGGHVHADGTFHKDGE